MMAQDAEVSPAFQPLVGVAAHLGGLIEVSGPSHDPGRFFAFQEGMLDIQILALGGWPTVSEVVFD